jgi:hypothetical protein
MSENESILNMLGQLLKEMDVVQSQGAGYYTCTPFAKRFNRLLAHTREVLASKNGLLATFEALDENDPKDPADKLKVLLEIRIEIGQLIALIESADPEEKT